MDTPRAAVSWDRGADREPQILVTADGGIRDVNDAAVACYGRPRAELVGMRFGQLIAGDGDDAAAMKDGEGLEALIGFFEQEHLRADGSRFPVEVHAVEVRVGGEQVALLGIRDRSTSAHEQALLRASEARYSAMITNISDVIGIMGVDGLMKYKSPNIEKWFGWKPEDLIGTDGWLTVHPDDVERLQKAFFELLQTQGEATTVEYQYLCKDGGYRWIELTATNLTQDPVIDGVLLNYHDITERKNAQRLGAELSSVIDVIGSVAEMRDPYTAGHQRRVAELAQAIAADMGMSESQVEEIRIAGLLHDIGKMAVPAEILSKPSVLTAVERRLVEVHSEAGYSIISSARMPGLTAELVYQHHERCDGTGYPRGLGSDELLDGSKVLMVADVAEAMMSHRPYRPAKGKEAALDEISRGAGTCYDADVARSCAQVLEGDAFAFSIA